MKLLLAMIVGCVAIGSLTTRPTRLQTVLIAGLATAMTCLYALFPDAFM